MQVRSQIYEVLGPSGVGKSYTLKKFCRLNRLSVLFNQSVNRFYKPKNINEYIESVIFSITGKTPNVILRSQWHEFLLENQEKIPDFSRIFPYRRLVTVPGSELLYAEHFLYTLGYINILSKSKKNIPYIFFEEGLLQRCLGSGLPLDNGLLLGLLDFWFEVCPSYGVFILIDDPDVILERVIRRGPSGIHRGKTGLKLRNDIISEINFCLELGDLVRSRYGSVTHIVSRTDISSDLAELHKVCQQ